MAQQDDANRRTGGSGGDLGRLDTGRETRLGGARDGRLYCTRGRTVGVWTPVTGFRPLGTLPVPGRGASNAAFRLRNGALAQRLLRPVVGAWTTTNLWPLSDEALLATHGLQVYRSGDRGRSWAPVHRLPPSSGPMGVLPTSVCRHDGRLYLAEYTLGDEPARILESRDDGRTWGTYLETTAVRHFHGVFDDPHRDALWATSGDTDRESAVGRLEDGRFVRVGSGSQQWRAVSLAFTPSAVLWGMDCSYADEPELLRLDRDGAEAPTTVGTTDGSIYYSGTLRVDGDRWVAFTTAAETGRDSTAEPEQHGGPDGDLARVLVASAASDYERWHELAAFQRRRPAGGRVPGVPTANAYVFLATDPSLGLLMNPFNTRTGHGSVLRIPPERLPQLAAESPTLGGALAPR